MADKTERLKLLIETDDKASGGLKAVGKEALKLGDDLDDTRTKGEKVADALKEIGDSAKVEFSQAEAAASALGTALGPEFASKVGANGLNKLVSDLKQTGLTYDDIKQDADALAQAIKHVDDVGSSLGGAQAGAKDLGNDLDKVGDKARQAADQVDSVGSTTRNLGGDFDHVSDRADNTRSVVANFTGNTLSELPGVTNAFGPLNMAIGQFGEYATEGNIKMSSLVTAGAGLGLVAIAMSKLADKAAEVAATKAWRREQINGYRDAIAEGADAAQALVDRLREAGEIKFDVAALVGFDDLGQTDIVPLMAQYSVSVTDFANAATGSEASLRAFKEEMIAAGVPVKAAALITATAEQQQKAYNKALEDAAEAGKVFAGELDQTNNTVNVFESEAVLAARAAEELQRSIHHAGEAARDGGPPIIDTTGSIEHMGEAARESAAKTKELEDAITAADVAYQELTGTLSQREALLNLNQSLDEFKWKMGEGKLSVREQQQALIDIQQELAEYTGGLEGIPPEKKTNIYAAISRGDIEEAKRLIDEATRDRTITIGIAYKVAAGSQFLNPTPKVQGATGGIVTRPTVALIGEAGPEAVIPLNKTPGSRPLPALGGGITMHNTFNNGVDVDSFAQVLALKLGYGL